MSQSSVTSKTLLTAISVNDISPEQAYAKKYSRLICLKEDKLQKKEYIHVSVYLVRVCCVCNILP